MRIQNSRPRRIPSFPPAWVSEIVGQILNVTDAQARAMTPATIVAVVYR